jgi:hypothetical protein
MWIRMLEHIIPDLQQTRLSLKVEKNVAEFCNLAEFFYIYLAAALPSSGSCVAMCVRVKILFRHP